MRHNSLPSSRSVARCVEALNLAHHFLNSHPRFVENLCEKFWLVDGIRGIGDYRADAAFTRHLPVCLRIIALVCDNGAGIDIGTELEEHFKVAAVASFAPGQMEANWITVEIGLEMDFGRKALPGLAVLAGAGTFGDIALFGRMKLEFLRWFRPFRDDTPLHDHLGDILASLDAEQFQQCFAIWVASVTGAPAGVITIDGKTSRRSYQKKNAKTPIHMVSAFAARQRRVLGYLKVAEKSNEIVAIHHLLCMRVIEGAIVTIDAMSCQREIAAKIMDKKTDYILAPKGNQGASREDVEVLAAEQKANGFADTTIGLREMVDSDHGRIETRTTTVIHDVVWLRERHDWPGLQSIVMLESVRETGDRVERKTRFTLRRWCCWRSRSGHSSAIIGRWRTVCAGS